VTTQHTPSRTTTWDNPFLEPPRKTWKIAVTAVVAVILLLGAISAVLLSL
jgi:hypothetical protein